MNSVPQDAAGSKSLCGLKEGLDNFTEQKYIQSIHSKKTPPGEEVSAANGWMQGQYPGKCHVSCTLFLCS